MLDRALDRFAATVTQRRGRVVALVLVVAALCASQIPRLRTDPAPENLMISYGDYEPQAREFRRHFGDTDSVVALLVAADDVTARSVLEYVHAVSRHFQRDAKVHHVASLTVTPLPGAVVPESPSVETLEDLDDEEDAPASAPRFQAAVETLVAVEPERFPLGLSSVAERVGGGSEDVLGAVRGDTVTEEEAAAIQGALEDAPLVVGRLVSRDRKVAAVVLYLDRELGTGPERTEMVHAIDAWLAAHPPPRGVSVHAAGIPHLRTAISDHMIEDQTFIVPVAVLLCSLLLYLSFRWSGGVVVPLAMVSLIVACVLGMMAIFEEPLSVLMNMLPTLLIIMGISEAVHVVGRYVEESRKTSDRIEASRRALRGLMTACFLTSFTTAVGFGALAVADTELLQRFGVVAGLGVMVQYAILITFVPAVITSFPPSRTLVRTLGTRKGWVEGLLVRMTAKIAHRRIAVVVVAVVAMVPCAWAYSAMNVDTALLDTFDADDPIAVSTRLVERHLDGILPLQIHVSSDGQTDLRDPDVLAALDRVARWAQKQDGVLRTTTPADPLWESWRQIAGIGPHDPRTPFRNRAQVDALVTILDRVEPNPIFDWMTRDGRHARFEVRLRDIGSRRSIALIGAIEARTREELAGMEGVRVVPLGEAYISTYGVEAVVDDLFGSLALSAFVIFLTIGLLFRSPRLGLLAIPPNVIPQLGTVGWMVLRGIPLNAATAIVFSVVIGVTVDLTIHGFARLIVERRRGLGERAAVVRVARTTGRAIVTACATLVIGFSVLMLSAFLPVRHFGELIAIALTLSLFATLVFQPAMMMMASGYHRGRRRKSPSTLRVGKREATPTHLRSPT